MSDQSTLNSNTAMSLKSLFKQRLFWKVLLVFWLTTIATILANIIITKEIAFNEYKTQHLRLKMQTLASEAINIYEHEGKKQLKTWYKKLARQEGIRVILLHSNEKPVVKLPKHFKHRDHNHDEFNSDHDHNGSRISNHFLKLADQHVISASGDAYILRILPSKYLRSTFNPEKLHGYRLLTSFCIILIGSLWIANSIAKPIQLLREASEKISRGELNISLVKDIGPRKDELGKLAQAFDTMAQKIDYLLEDQKRLFADISHEIRTPLTRQKLALELLKSDPTNLQLQNKIETQNSEIEHLISQLLTLLKVDNGQALNLYELNLEELLFEVCDQAELELDQKNLLLEREINPNLRIKGDRYYLCRAIENILSNAIKYAPESSGINMRATQNNENLIIEITDEGPGIPKNELNHILEPFYRADKSRNAKTGGYGLGLAIASNIIAKHKGQLSFQNLAPKGLKVTVTLPNVASDL